MSTIGMYVLRPFRWVPLAVLGLILLAPLGSQIAAQDSDSPPAAVETRIEDGVKVVEVSENGRTIKIHRDPSQRITVEFTETKDGKLITTLIEAKTSNELQEKHAEAFNFWWDYAADWRDKIDFSFGKYIVTPMENVIFFSFWTEDWLGSKVPFIVFWLLAGATFFTIRMGFFNIRGFKHAIHLTRGDYDKPDDTGEVSHFQALSSALSATVGLGNIAGVAIAIGMGGPGACFWMIVIGFLGMSIKFTECTLGQMYRKVDENGRVSGGAMHYLKDGLAEIGVPRLGKFLAIFFAVICIAASLGGGNTFQVVQSLGAIQQDIPLLNDYNWVYGLVMAFLVGIVIIGGIRSIGAVAGRIVPFMCGAYVLTALFILGKNFFAIDDAIMSVFRGAFNPDAIYGGFIGVLVIGIKRAVFSNEAGTGSAAIAHSAAKTDEPVSEGTVALLEPFIDTVIVCTMTALVIIITGAADDPTGATFVKNDNGAALTSLAFRTGGYPWFKWILNIAVVLFCYSTLISWSYYGERCCTYLFGDRSSIVFKLVFIGFVFLGSIVSKSNILVFSDLLILGMALPNILGLILLSGKVRRELDLYWAKYKSGELEPADPLEKLLPPDADDSKSQEG